MTSYQEIINSKKCYQDREPQHFSLTCDTLISTLRFPGKHDKAEINTYVDELNSKLLIYKCDVFLKNDDATKLIPLLCSNISPKDEPLAAKTSHLLNNILTKQKLQFSTDLYNRVLAWHIGYLKICSDIIFPDILHNIQCILQVCPQIDNKFIDDLIGVKGIIISLIDTEKSQSKSQNTLEIQLSALKCVVSLISLEESKAVDSTSGLATELKEYVALVLTNFLMKGPHKTHDEFLYCKVVISALRALTQVYFNHQNVSVSLPEVIGICRYYVLYGLVSQGAKPEKIMPAQQSIAIIPVVQNTKGGKKQKLRKQRNNAIDSLKKEIPVSDRSLMKDVGCFENCSAYTPASTHFLETQKARNCANLTSDSDMSDVEISREAKLIALRSRVRQSASNLLLVMVKVREKREMFGYWWALLPDSPEPNNWALEGASKKTLAYCALTDPIAASRASVLSVILALLSGSRIYLSQAEVSKKESSSFIPFSVTLGYIITCMHKALISILETERSHAVIIVALKCCAALVQATPYHRMGEGLISDVVKCTWKFLVHRDVTLQVGALITMGCVLSVDPKVDEVIKAIEKDVPFSITNKEITLECDNQECDDFEEGYSDDEICTVEENSGTTEEDTHLFRSWILDICLKNMGWIFKGNEVIRCKPSVIPVILESLQVISAIAFHHLHELLNSHIVLLGNILSELLQHEHQDVVLQAARTVSIIGDAMQKLEQSSLAPPLAARVWMWARLLRPLAAVLQASDNAPAKAVACDCIANIGEKAFHELPRGSQVLCCTLVMGSCGDAAGGVRGAAVRALAMTVVYRHLREDIGFVCDCGENILRALAEPILIVRTKAAWALGNLTDALVLNMEESEIEEIDDDLLYRLLEASVQCAADNDKIKMSATRSLGNLLRIITNEHLVRNPQLKPLCDSAIGKLLECACKVTNMKVRWNACYAIGNAMKNEQLFTCFSGWQDQVLISLSKLTQECKNLKVRITAATASRAPASRAAYGGAYAAALRALLAALGSAPHVDDCTEYKHKDNLIEQLCVTLSHMCCLLKPEDLPDILDPLVFHYDCAKSLLSQVINRLPPEHASCNKILQAAKYVTVDLKSTTDTQTQALSMLQNIFLWDV